MTQQRPFKFLDAYQQADEAVFFGREKETQDLYDALSGVKHLLIYGPSGAGKTSLIECGLRNQFSDADWFALSIRRGENINASVFARINEALQETIALHPETGLPQEANVGFEQLIEQLFEERFQPVYLLFDQFEELLILGNAEEKKEFFARLNQLIRYRVPCRIMLIMREEFIGHLSEFEPLCPSIFKHRFRLEKMRKEKVRTVIDEMLEAEEYAPFYTVKDSKHLANSILDKLPDGKREIELTHVQVFLSELWDRAKQQTTAHTVPLLAANLVTDEDDLEGVLNSFLQKQLKALNEAYKKNNALEVLATMISERHTKLQLSQTAIAQDLQHKGLQLAPLLPNLLQDLEKRRLIRALKAGEQTQYEISHDLLALAVGQNLTEEMQLRQKAWEVYKVYAERQGFLSQDDLDFIRPYQAYKTYPMALAEKIGASEQQLKAAQQKELETARKRNQRLVGLLMTAVLALFVAGWQYFEANKATQKAQIETQKVLANDLLYKAQTALRNGKRNTAFRLVEYAHLYIASDNTKATKVLYDIYTNETLVWRGRVFKGHTSSVMEVVFSPDGKYIATASWDHTARLWNAKTGEAITIFKGHEGFVDAVAFSPDGKYIATVSRDKTARLWNIKTGEAIITFKGHTSSVIEVVFSPDGKYIATASWDKTAKLWNIKTGEAITTFKGHTSSIYEVAFSPDGKYIATVSRDKTARLWNTKTGKDFMTFKGHEDAIYGLTFSSDGKYIATASMDKTAKLWNIKTGEVITTFKGHEEGIWGVTFSPDGKYIATASRDKTAKLWNIKTGEVITTFKGHKDGISGVTFSPDGKYIATASGDKTARLWNAKTREDFTTFKGHEDTVFGVAFSPDGEYIATASWDKTTRLWNTKTGKDFMTFKGHEDAIYEVAFSPDGNYIATASMDKTARLWNTKTGEALTTFKGHTSDVRGVAFSPDGNYIVTASKDKMVGLWNIKTGEVITIFKGHTSGVYSIAFSPDGNYIATASMDKTARLWNIKTGETITIFKGHTSGVYSIAFSPDGKYIVTASRDKTARLWNIKTREGLRTFKGHNNELIGVSFSPNGKYIATASGDNTTKLWDIKTGEAITFKEHNKGVVGVAFSPDGNYIATASSDKTARLWPITAESILSYMKRKVSIEHLSTAQISAYRLHEYLSPEGFKALSNYPNLDYLYPFAFFYAREAPSAPPTRQKECLEKAEVLYQKILALSDRKDYRESYDAFLQSKKELLGGE